jgi:hypothetical protein
VFYRLIRTRHHGGAASKWVENLNNATWLHIGNYHDSHYNLAPENWPIAPFESLDQKRRYFADILSSLGPALFHYDEGYMLYCEPGARAFHVTSAMCPAYLNGPDIPTVGMSPYQVTIPTDVVWPFHVAWSDPWAYTLTNIEGYEPDEWAISIVKELWGACEAIMRPVFLGKHSSAGRIHFQDGTLSLEALAPVLVSICPNEDTMGNRMQSRPLPEPSYSAAYLAGKPGMPATKRGVNAWIKRNGIVTVKGIPK